MCAWEWTDLRQPLIDLVLLFYNGDYLTEPNELIDSLTAVFEILNFWRGHGKAGDYDLTPANLMNFMVDIIVTVISEVHARLLHKAAHYFEIVSFHRPKLWSTVDPHLDGAPDGFQQLDEAIVASYAEKPE